MYQNPSISVQISLKYLKVKRASYLPRDAMRKRGLCCWSRCLSIRLSRSCILSRRLKISSNFFVGPVAPSFQFFDPSAPIPILRGIPCGGAKYKGWENFCDFRLKSPCITVVWFGTRRNLDRLHDQDRHVQIDSEIINPITVVRA